MRRTDKSRGMCLAISSERFPGNDMDTFNYADSVQVLLGWVPEFAGSEVGWNADLPYDVFGTFAQFLCRRIHEDASEDFLRRSFGLINAMARSDDEEVQNLLVVSVFELLCDDARCLEVAERYLSGEAVSLLHRTKNGWR